MRPSEADKRTLLQTASIGQYLCELGANISEEEAIRSLRWHARFLPADLLEDYSSLVVVEVATADSKGASIDALAFRRICDRVAKRLTYQLRQHTAKLRPLEEAQDLAQVATNPGEKADLEIATREILRSLAPEDQILLTMRFIEGRSREEIAAALGFSLPTLHRRLKKALDHARRVLVSSS